MPNFAFTILSEASEDVIKLIRCFINLSGWSYFMNVVKIAGLLLLVLVWLWLCWSLISLAGGWTLKNIFLIIASAIIIFVPIWKKYSGADNAGK